MVETNLNGIFLLVGLLLGSIFTEIIWYAIYLKNKKQEFIKNELNKISPKAKEKYEDLLKVLK